MAENKGDYGLSRDVLGHPEAQNSHARARIALAKIRIQSVLDTHFVANQRTLEQKISDQGPTNQRVDPHLVGLALQDLLNQNRIRTVENEKTKKLHWYINITTKDDKISEKLNNLAYIYHQITSNGFGNLTGDALELIVFKILREIRNKNNRFSYHGHFDLSSPKKNGRYVKIEPPKTISGNSTQKTADFLQYGFDSGPLCIECKNYREWLYPRSHIIKELIIKAYELDSIPVLIHRRIHYTTIRNLLEPAGIIAHETYNQYYPEDKKEIASKAKNKNLLGFSDIIFTEEPSKRTHNFIGKIIPGIVGNMFSRWQSNKDVLFEYPNGSINLAQLYNYIDSPAQGNWKERESEGYDIPF